jgi:hypothetical protein
LAARYRRPSGSSTARMTCRTAGKPWRDWPWTRVCRSRRGRPPGSGRHDAPTVDPLPAAKRAVLPEELGLMLGPWAQVV